MVALDILYEDNHLLAVNKPAGMATMGTTADQPSLLAACKQYLKRKYNKPGQVYLGVVSRLDAPVTGVLLLARTSKAAARLSATFRDRQVQKRYWALVERTPDPREATLKHFLRKDESQRRMVVCSGSHPQAQPSSLRYHVRGRAGRLTWLDIELLTGRKHQIRVQLAAIRCPIAGDQRYGSNCQFQHGIALHARSLELTHPVRRQTLRIEAPPPPYWPPLIPSDES